MSTIELKVPNIGDFKDVEIIEVLVKPGDTVRAEQSLVTVESDKASMEIPSASTGTIKEIRVKLGDRINEGTVLALIEVQEGAKTGPSGASPPPVVATEPAATPRPAPAAPAPAPSVASAAASAMPQGPGASTGPVDVVIPDMGDFESVEVIEILVKVGDVIALDQSLITVESDKASMEIPSAAAGAVREIKVKLGDKVAKGTVVAVVEGTSAQAAPDSVQQPARASSVAPPATAPAASPSVPVAALAPTPDASSSAAPVASASSGASQPHASPSVRKFARELGVDLSRVSGTAAKGRITQEDVQAFVKGALSAPAATAGASAKASGGSGLNLLPWPSLDFSKFGQTESVALSRIKKISGPNLQRNWVTIPHVTQFDEADVGELEEFRKATNTALAKQNLKVTMLAFVMKACVAALQKFPNFNASLSEDGASLILKKYYHIGFAADTPNGLMVPVIRDCDEKGVAQLAAETAELAAKARDGKLSPAEMQGASFTISSLGGIGGTAFTPIINAPELAILGLSKTDFKPKWDGKTFVPRLMLPLSLSYDHRVIDGAQAARFTAFLADVLQDMRKILI